MDFPAVCVDQRLGNGEAKSETSKTAGNLDLSLFECIKDLIDLLAFDTNTGVDDPSLPFEMRVTSSKSSINRASSSTLRRTTSSASLTGWVSGASASSSPTIAITGARGLRNSCDKSARN